MAAPDPDKERKQRIALLFMLSFWALLAAFVFGVKPNLDAARQAGVQAEELRNQIERARQMSDVRGAVEKRVEEAKATIDELEGVMLQGDAFNYLVRQISEIARHRNVEVINIRPDYAESRKPREDLPYIDAHAFLEISGAYDAIGETVAELERCSPMLSVVSVEIMQGTELPWHRGKLELSLLCMEEPEEPEGPPAARSGG